MAREVVRKGKVDQGILNLIEMSFRNYDPCLACATHAFPGQTPLLVVVRDSGGREIARIER